MGVKAAGGDLPLGEGYAQVVDMSPENRKARQAAFLEAYRECGNRVEAAEKVGISVNTVKRWVARSRENESHAAFASEFIKLGGMNGYPEGHSRRLSVQKKIGEGEPFPAQDFLRYRELACAYLVDHQDGTGDSHVAKATNSWVHSDAYNRLQSHKRLVVVMPPFHLKTSFFSIEYPTWLLMSNRNRRISVIQKNADEAKKLVSSVQERLGDPEFYEYMASRLVDQGETPIVNPLLSWFRNDPFKSDKRGYGDKWGATAFKVTGRTSGEKDHSMQALGVGGQIQGQRADLIILDDVQDPMDGITSPADGRKLLSWFNAVILGRVKPSQQVVVLANFFSPHDFAHLLIEDHPEFVVVEYPALIDATVDPNIPEGELSPLMPDLWTVEELEAKKSEVGEQVWHYTWMQDHSSYEGATFRREMVEGARDPDLLIGQVPSAVDDIFLGVDPAAVGYCAMVVWGLDRTTKHRYLIDVFNEKGMRTWNNVIAQIAEFCRTYPIRKVIVEGNNTQKAGLTDDPTFQKELRNLGTRWEVYQSVTGTGSRAIQSNFDITTIGALFDSEMVTIPYGGGTEDRNKVDAYVDQLCNWRTDEDGNSIKHLIRDMVMATLFAESEAFTLSNRPVNHGKPKRAVPTWVKGKEGKFRWQTGAPRKTGKIRTLA